MKDRFKILDKGFIRVIDTMGDDSSIVQAARVSYGDGTKHVSQDTALINYLMKNNHTSPFEMCEIKLHIKLPIFIARQWIRHRTANVNEYSARYSIVKDDYYMPTLNKVKLQDSVNKQASGDVCDEELATDFQFNLKHNSEICYETYEHYLNLGISREMCRILLPVNFYTEMYWKIDLHNLLHFVRLRNDKHAQYEIREYAKCIQEKIIKEWCPITYAAFKKHKK